MSPVTDRAELRDLDPPSAALRILGGVLAVDGVQARIVEVEAYGGPPDGPWPDPAAHSFRGMTARNAVMFGSAGRVYVYRSHGLHFCLNISTGREGVASAVLLRGAVIEDGLGFAQRRRPQVRDAVRLCRGPGNLAAALGIDLFDNGTDVFSDSRIRLQLGDRRLVYEVGPRVGVTHASEVPWRFWIPGSPGVSDYRRSPRAPRMDGEQNGSRA